MPVARRAAISVSRLALVALGVATLDVVRADADPQAVGSETPPVAGVLSRRRVAVQLEPPPGAAKRIPVPAAPLPDPWRRHPAAAIPNALVNDPAGQPPFTGNTQMEPSIAVHGDTLVCGFTDSGGFFGSGTLTGWAVSFDGGQTWTDSGSLPNQGLGGSEMVYGDATLVTDGRGRWYSLSLYDLGNGSTGPGSGDIGLVTHVGRFFGATLQWSLPHVVVGGTTSLVDAPHLAIDPASGRLYATFTNFTPPLGGWGQVEVLTLAADGATQLHRVVVQPEVSQTNNAGSRVAVGPDGEVYCAWESGLLAGGDGQGPAYQKVAKSVNGGTSFSSPVVAATVIESWCSGPPGFNREEESVEFPSLAVDRSNGPRRGRVYLAWHDAVEMDFTGTLLPVAEAPVSNDLPQTAQVLPATSNHWQIDGALPSNDLYDWYRFSAQAGDHVRLIVRPNAYVQIGAQLRCGNPTGGGADTLLASSARRTGEWVFCLFTLPSSGDYFVRLDRRRYSGSYTAWLRKTTVTFPSTGIDHRDVVVVASPDGVSGWTPKLRVNDDTGFTDQAFPEVVVDEEGGAHLTWYDRRYDPRCRALADVMLASSFDGGQTFTPNIRLTGVSSFWQVPADAVPNFGDRFMPAAQGDVLYAAWADGRLGDPDVMMAPVRFGFDVILPDTVRAVVGQGLGLAIEVHNATPYDGARFDIAIAASAPQLADTTLVVQPVAAGASQAALYDPTIGNWIHDEQPVELSVTVTSDRSGRVFTGTVWAINDQVEVGLADFAATRGPDGVQLAWRAPDAAGFDVERAGDVAGPFVRVTPAPLRPSAGGDFAYEDTAAPAGERLAYRLVGIAAGGGRQFFGPWVVESAPVARLALLGARPNPFNPSTSVRFELPRAADVTLRILDVRGRVVRTLVGGAPRAAGQHAVGWDGRDAAGVAQASGVYIAELCAAGGRRSARLVLLR